VARYLLFRKVMKTPIKYIVSIVALTAALTLPARATFEKETAPFGGSFLFFDVANSNVTDLTAFVGANDPSAPTVAIHTDGPVDTGSGFATIKPSSGSNLTELIFTPDDPNLFSDFNFRGQLTDAGDGTVTVTVQDNQGNLPQTFTFDNLGTNQDFARQGIISFDGETIQSVTITSDFKEFKQIRISFATGVPDGGATVMLLGAALGAFGMARRFLKS
jgi:VPDSG-CTERM exosortase interaction domain